MMKKTLDKKYNTKIIIDEREGLFRKFYNFLGRWLLKYKWSWNISGWLIAKHILDENPDIVILIIDISASSIPFLKKKGIYVIMSIEDLTWEWLNIEDDGLIREILREKLLMADEVITISKDVKNKLLELGIDATVIPPGLEKIHITRNEALNYFNNCSMLLHAGKIQHKDEFIIFNDIVKKLAGKYNIKAYSSGEYTKLLENKFPWINWYNYPTAEDAIKYLKNCRIGIIIRFRAHNPGRIYYHASMLQPIIAIGDEWTKEISENMIGVVTDSENINQAVNFIFNNYNEYLNNIFTYAEKNINDKTYEPLISMIYKITTKAKNKNA